MSDEEMEEFDMNEEDLIRAYNPGTSRGKKMSKEQAMLGIWAGNSDTDDSDHDEFSYKNQKKKSSINFVSGSKNPDKKSKKNTFDKDEDNSDEEISQEKIDDKISDDDDEYTEDYLNFRKKNLKDEIDDEESDENNEDESSLKNQFILNQLSAKSQKKPRQFQAKPKLFQNSSSSQPPKTQESKTKPRTNNFPEEHVDRRDIGNWERHTKGIGMKLLEKMGWQKGKGIGKDLQGRAVPVEAFVRRGKAAVGSYGPESKDIRVNKNKEDEENENQDNEAQPHVSQWKKDKKNKKPQYALRTAEELLHLAASNPKKLKRIEQMLEMSDEKQKPSKTGTNKIKIIDMTGREQRVLHGYESLSQRQLKPSEERENKQFDMPELIHNLDIIVNMTEDRILQSDKKIKHYEDMILAFEYEERKSNDKVNQQNHQVKKIQDLLDVIEKCEKSAQQENISLGDLIELFQELQVKYPDEFIIFNLSDVAIPLLVPMLKRKMLNWSPFEQDSEYENIDFIELFSDLKKLLSDVNSSSRMMRDDSSYMSPYHRLIWDTWMPAFRRISYQTSVKKYSFEYVDLLNKWKSLLPRWILTNILEKIILIKLVDEVNEWDPLTDTIPIHVWIHPWLPLLKDHLELNIFPTIRYKLANALNSWHPSDKSAKAILLPWQPPVFSIPNWNTFMCKYILPKLELILEDELEIAPNDQNLEPWNWIMSWIDLIPLANFISLLEKSFFPKWLKVLCIWLNSSSPNYEEISKWYMGWKSVFHEKLVQHPSIKSKLSQGLIMMNNSVSGIKVSYNVSPATEPVAPAPTETDESLKIKGVQMTANPSINTFKDMIERKASEKNLLFLPVINKFKEGKQIYKLGNLNIYLDRNVAFMLQNGSWIPASINDIVQKAI